MKKQKSIGVIGARSLPHTATTQVGDVVEDLLGKGYHIGSGGALGADEFCLSRLVHIGEAAKGTIYSPWKDFSGFPVKVRALTRQFKDFGGSVLWGPVTGKEDYNMVRTALLQRNLRLIEAVDGVVAFITGDSRGTLFTLRKALQKHFPVVIFPFNCDLPEFDNVKWKALKCCGCWEGGYKAVYVR